MTLHRSGRFLAAAASIALSASALGQTPVPATPGEKPPAGPVEPPPPSAEQRAEGKALFAKVVEWLGGQKKVSSVRDVQTRGQLTAKTPEGELTMEVQSAMVFPAYLAQQIESPFGRVAMVATPTGAFLVGPNGSQDLPPQMAEEFKKQEQRIPLHLAQKADDPQLWLAAAGKERIGSVDASILDIRYGPVVVRWYVDPKTGRIMRTSHTSTTPEGKPVQMVSDYSDYKIVSGFPVAHRLEVTTNGERDQTLVLEECKINAGVDPKLFEKPPAPPATPAAAAPAPTAPPKP
jgi:hypothetical protein